MEYTSDQVLKAAPESGADESIHYKPVVQTTGDPKWYSNALVFATYAEAEGSARALMWRWMAVTDTGVVVSYDPVNYRHVDGVDQRIEEGS